jgi:ribose transport system substrate-binding protein
VRSSTVSATLCLVGCLGGLAACGGDSDSGSSATATAKQSGTPSNKHYDVAFVPGNTAAPYFISMKCGIESAAKPLNVSVSTTGPAAGDVPKQIAALNAAIAKHPDAILLDAEDEKAFDAPVRQATASGIKVFFINSRPVDKSLGTGFVTNNDEVGGKLAGEEMVKLAGAQGGSVVVVGTIPGIPVLKQRQDGFTEAIKASPKPLKFAGAFFDPQNDAAKQTGMVAAALSKHSDMVGAFGLFDGPGTAALSAVRAAGKTGKVKVIVLDATPALIDQLKAGEVQGLVVPQSATAGSVALKQLVDVLGGGAPKGTTAVDPVLITADTLAASEKYLDQSC